MLNFTYKTIHNIVQKIQTHSFIGINITQAYEHAPHF